MASGPSFVDFLICDHMETLFEWSPELKVYLCTLKYPIFIFIGQLSQIGRISKEDLLIEANRKLHQESQTHDMLKP